jgi:hypothetical protein
MPKFIVWFEKRGYIEVDNAVSVDDAESKALGELYYGGGLTSEGKWEMVDETEEVADTPQFFF